MLGGAHLARGTAYNNVRMLKKESGNRLEPIEVDLSELRSNCCGRKVWVTKGGLGCHAHERRCAPQGYEPGTRLNVNHQGKTVLIEVVAERVVTSIRLEGPEQRPVWPRVAVTA